MYSSRSLWLIFHKNYSDFYLINPVSVGAENVPPNAPPSSISSCASAFDFLTFFLNVNSFLYIYSGGKKFIIFCFA